MVGPDQDHQTVPSGEETERPDRRVATKDRRQAEERRSLHERRFDNRLAPVKPHKTLKLWLRSLTHARLGVDRRKRNERRKQVDRRKQQLKPLLTPEEIADLLA